MAVMFIVVVLVLCIAILSDRRAEFHDDLAQLALTDDPDAVVEDTISDMYITDEHEEYLGGDTWQSPS